MASDRIIGAGIFASSVIGVVVYAVLLLYWEVLVLAVTAFVAVALLLGILAWIGYTMATTPPLEPITDLPGTLSEKKAEPGPSASPVKPESAAQPQS
ncbi:MAG: hypothetical protein LYZ66_00075 [Nitrososphaerales archaeon]|nr:hypothetical protein [Nitrososphaerales archaeon]